jgi:hypothetical protein
MLPRITFNWGQSPSLRDPAPAVPYEHRTRAVIEVLRAHPERIGELFTPEFLQQCRLTMVQTENATTGFTSPLMVDMRAPRREWADLFTPSVQLLLPVAFRSPDLGDLPIGLHQAPRTRLSASPPTRAVQAESIRNCNIRVANAATFQGEGFDVWIAEDEDGGNSLLAPHEPLEPAQDDLHYRYRIGSFIVDPTRQGITTGLPCLGSEESPFRCVIIIDKTRGTVVHHAFHPSMYARYLVELAVTRSQNYFDYSVEHYTVLGASLRSLDCASNYVQAVMDSILGLLVAQAKAAVRGKLGKAARACNLSAPLRGFNQVGPRDLSDLQPALPEPPRLRHQNPLGTKVREAQKKSRSGASARR